MPAKLERCVKHVLDQGKDKSSAYAICSKTTGYVKSGKHSWRKKQKVEESTLCSKGAIARIEQILEENNNFLSEYRTGVFASVDLDPTGLEKIWKYMKQIGIQPMPINKAHITVIFSRNRPTSEPKALPISGSVRLKSFGIFGKGTKKSPYAFVIEMDSPELQKLHMEYRRKYGLKPTYPEYKPHLSITYDIERIIPGLKKLNNKQKQTLINVFNKMLPELPKSVRILKSTVEPVK
jgi:2'-5' RNA ligase